MHGGICFDQIRTLKETEVIHHFGSYLLNKATSRFEVSDINDADRLCPISGLPSFESIMTILKVICRYENFDPKEENTVIARAAMFYLLSMVSSTLNFSHWCTTSNM
jgi:hypothetical protein